MHHVNCVDRQSARRNNDRIRPISTDHFRILTLKSRIWGDTDQPTRYEPRGRSDIASRHSAARVEAGWIYARERLSRYPEYLSERSFGLLCALFSCVNAGFCSRIAVAGVAQQFEGDSAGYVRSSRQQPRKHPSTAYALRARCNTMELVKTREKSCNSEFISLCTFFAGELRTAESVEKVRSEQGEAESNPYFRNVTPSVASIFSTFFFELRCQRSA